MSDLGLDDTSSPQAPSQRGRPSGQDGDLFERLVEGVAIMGIARQGSHADDEAPVQGRGRADLAPEFVADAGLVPGDAVDRGVVQGVELVAAPGLLVQEA
ncbi:hypothetical protein BV392_06730 [Rhodovulum sulfidophilum]|nr:hypothetical protein BV392_06730 [Rhodovulum sulfidophilum]